MTKKSRVPALDRAMSILEVLQKNHHCSVSEILNETNLPRSTVYVLIEENIDCLAVHFGIMDGDRAYYVIKKTSPKAGVRIMSREGAQISLLHAGLGKCLLAFQNSELRERILTSLDYTPITSTSITSPEALRRELANIQLQGWAFDNSEGEAEIRCIAVPVFDGEHNLLGAISIVGTINKFSTDVLPNIVEKVKTDSIML